MSRTTAVFFDVDFTLIRPGRRFQAAGYLETCARHGVTVAPELFRTAVTGAASCLDASEHLFDAQVFINYTSRIIELMGGTGAGVDAASRELYTEWGNHEHFRLYDDVAETLRALRERGVRVGLISNGHRPLGTFPAHFGLTGLVDVGVSSALHGYMKPHPSIFRAALAKMGVQAADAMMVGDSHAHDIIGARVAGMRAVLLARGEPPLDADPDVPVIRSLRELPALL